MDSDLVVALRSRGVTVITPLDVGLIEKTDEEQLVMTAYSTRSTSAISTDFTRNGSMPDESMPD
jgi:hypothetical protein